MKKILKLLSYVLVIRIVFNLFNENTTIKEQIDKLKEEITNLEISDLDKKIKDFQEINTFWKYENFEKVQKKNNFFLKVKFFFEKISRKIFGNF